MSQLTIARNLGYTGSNNVSYAQRYTAAIQANNKAVLFFGTRPVHRNFNTFNGQYTFRIRSRRVNLDATLERYLIRVFDACIEYVRAQQNIRDNLPMLAVIYDRQNFRTATTWTPNLTGRDIVNKVSEVAQSSVVLDITTAQLDIVYGRVRQGGGYGKMYTSADDFCARKTCITKIISSRGNDCFFQSVALGLDIIAGGANKKKLCKQANRIRAAHEIRENVGVHNYGEFVDFNSLSVYENYFGVGINIVGYKGLKFLRTSDIKEKQITLLFVESDDNPSRGHFHYVASGKEGSLWDRSKMCWDCMKPFHTKDGHKCLNLCLGCHKHECVGSGYKWHEFKVKCPTCNKECYDESCLELHKGKVCTKLYKCKDCRALYNPKKPHMCDFHICQTCSKMVEIGSHKCYMQPIEPPKNTCDGYVFYDYEVMFSDNVHVVAGIVAMYMDTDEVLRFTSNETFIDWIFRKEHKNYTFIAHNAGRYDGHFIKKAMIERELKQTTICNGNTILYCESASFKIRFIDSYRFIPMGLRNFPKTFGLTAVSKSYFPYRFFTIENRYYEGRMPDIAWFDFHKLKDSDRAEAEEWYMNMRNTNINLYDMCMDYCVDDVKLLKAGCIKFRELFMKITQGEIDPFHSITIASVCMKIFKRFHLKPDTIAILNPCEDKTDELRWLSSIVREPNTVYLYRKCIDYGCPLCFMPHTRHPITSEKMHELYYVKHISEINEYERCGKQTHVMWECYWLKKNKKAKHFFDLRDAFGGGHTEPTKMYYKGEDVSYFDYTSLYPSVQSGRVRGVTKDTYDTLKPIYYPVGHPDYIFDNFRDVKDYFGFIKCSIIPPLDLYHPVLGEKKDGKYVFDLLPKEGIWTTMEINKAVEKGYIIEKIYGVCHFPDKSCDLFADYVRTFLKIKQQAAGWRKLGCTTDEEKHAYIQKYYDVEGIMLEEVEENPGLYYIAKLCLNSLWGKFGQRVNFGHCIDTYNQDDFEKYAYNDKYDVKGIIMHNNTARTINYTYKQAFEKQSKDINIAIAAFTTAHARLRLYDALEVLDKRVLYMDTDSVIFHGQSDLVTGPFLGDLTNELDDGEVITEYVSAGPKSYAYLTSKGKTVCKVKGFCLDNIASKIINFNTLKSMVVNKEDLKPRIQGLQFNIGKQHGIATKKWETEEDGKIFSVTFDKRDIKDFDGTGIDTFPFGYFNH